jgi:hypothetical protein
MMYISIGVTILMPLNCINEVKMEITKVCTEIKYLKMNSARVKPPEE